VIRAAAETGHEYLVDARGCDPRTLQSLPELRRLFERVVHELELRPVGPAAWHVFPGPGGITGAWLFADAHLTIHTCPEAGVAAINLYSWARRAEWPWDARLRDLLDAEAVSVRVLQRGEEESAGRASARVGGAA
jgi:S-adenosylmethionine decarboxylase